MLVVDGALGRSPDPSKGNRLGSRRAACRRFRASQPEPAVHGEGAKGRVTQLRVVRVSEPVQDTWRHYAVQRTASSHTT
jgi:hypothetical protein